MTNEIHIGFRLISETADLTPIADLLDKYQFSHRKKGEPVRPNSSFRAEVNVIFVNNVVSTVAIEQDRQKILDAFCDFRNIVSAVAPTVRKEFNISCSMLTGQFGFLLDNGLLREIADGGFCIAFSGIGSG